MYVVRAAVDDYPISRSLGTASTESRLANKLMRAGGFDAAASRGARLLDEDKDQGSK